jgi:glucokinase
MILSGDVGGTKTVLALFETGVGHLEKVKEQTFASKDFAHLDEMCARFLLAHGTEPVHTACFGVPGVVVDGACKTTNLPWSLEERALAQSLHVPRVKLLNDLQAGALGMLQLKDDELAPLNPGKIDRRKNLAVVSPGTGLGEGMLALSGDDHDAVASEGGHCTFAPQSEREMKLAQWLAQQHGGHVSWERVLSGAGLTALYTFLRDGWDGDGHHDESREVRAKLDAAGSASAGAAVIGTEAVNGTDRMCVAAAEWFAALLGAEAGNVALKFMALGGVFIGGGMAPKLLPILQRGAVARAFIDKGRFAPVLRSVPLYVALNEKAPLIGAARYAARA